MSGGSDREKHFAALVDLLAEFKDYLAHSERWSRAAWEEFIRRFAEHGVQPLPSSYTGRVFADDVLAAVVERLNEATHA